MNKFEKIKALDLESYQKITIIKRDEAGNIEVLQKKFLSVEPFIPYEGAADKFTGAILTLGHTRNRKEYPLRKETIQYFQEYIIYDGWVDINLDNILYEPHVTEKGNHVRFLKYPSYQPYAFLDILEAYPDCLGSDI